MKGEALVPVPAGVVTVTLPLVAPAGTVVRMAVSEFTVKVAAVPLNFTAVAPVKAVPVSITAVPTRPLVGFRDVMAGAGEVTEKDVALVAVPPGVVTARVPVVAPAGTTVLIDVSELTVKRAVVPLKLTAEVPVRSVPVSVTAVPTTPLAGVKEAMVGRLVES